MRRAALVVFTLVAIAGPAASAQDTTPGPASFQELVEAGQHAQRQNDLSTAAARYKDALKMDSNVPELHANLGLVDYQLGDSANACQEFQTALRLKPSLFVPNLFLGLLYLKKNESSTALTYLSQAVRLNPRDLEVNLSLGRTYTALNKDSEAIAAYSNAVKFHPSSEEGWYGLGASYLNRAESLRKRLTASGTVSANTPYGAIRADQRLGIGALTQAVTVAPHSIRIHLLLGDLYRRKGQYPAAQKEFQQALELDNNNLPALLGLATTLYLNGESGSAEKIASRVLTYKPDDPESRLLIAEILLAQHRYSDAYKYVNPVPAGKADLVAEIHGIRGKIFAATNRPNEAIAELKKAVDDDPQGDLTYVLARQYQLLGDRQSADEAFQRSKILRQQFNEHVGYKFEVRGQN